MAVKKFTDETYGMGPIPVTYSDKPGSGSFRSQELDALAKRKMDYDTANADAELDKWRKEKLSGLSQALAMFNQNRGADASPQTMPRQMRELQNMLFKLNTYSPQDLRILMNNERYASIPGYGK